VETRTWTVGSESWTVRIVDGHADLPEGMPAVPACAFYHWDGQDEGCSSLISVTIPLSVTVIGKFAFCRCPALEEVTIPPSLTTIGTYAFSKCPALKAVMIPPSVSAIGYKAFEGCVSQLGAALKVETRTWTVDSESWTVRIVNGHAELPEGMPAVPDFAFSVWDGQDEGCSSLKSITIPMSVTTIGNGAFGNCAALKVVTLPPSVTKIGNGAFLNCTALKAATIPPSVNTIGYRAFYNCLELETLTIPSTTSIGDGAIPSMTTVTKLMPEEMDAAAQVHALVARGAGDEVEERTWTVGSKSWSVRIVDGHAELPEGIAAVPKDAFSHWDGQDKGGRGKGCKSLTSVTIPPSVTTIEDGAFNKCKALKAVTIPASVMTIGEFAFRNCEALKDVTIPSTVTTIEYGAFFNCEALRAVTIPSTASIDPRGAFHDVKTVTKLTPEEMGAAVQGQSKDRHGGCSTEHAMIGGAGVAWAESDRWSASKERAIHRRNL